jgi:hypothetical protein
MMLKRGPQRVQLVKGSGSGGRRGKTSCLHSGQVAMSGRMRASFAVLAWWMRCPQPAAPGRRLRPDEGRIVSPGKAEIKSSGSYRAFDLDEDALGLLADQPPRPSSRQAVDGGHLNYSRTTRFSRARGHPDQYKV